MLYGIVTSPSDSDLYLKFFDPVLRIRSVTLSPALLLAITVATACAVLQSIGMDTVLRFDRTSIDNGHWWLLLTGNFVHLGLNHLALNLAGFALIVALVWTNFNAREWLIIILVCSFGVGSGLYLLDPEIHWYVGFSGTLHGLIIAGTLADFRRYPKPAALLLVLVLAKLGWEQVKGAMPGIASVAGGNVVVNSHLYGAITGAVLAALILLLHRRRQTPP